MRAPPPPPPGQKKSGEKWRNKDYSPKTDDIAPARKLVFQPKQYLLMLHYSFGKNKHHFFNAKKTTSPIYPLFKPSIFFPFVVKTRLPPLQVSSCWRHSKSNCFVPNCTNCTDSSLTDSSLPSVSLAALTLPSGERLGPSAGGSMATDPEGHVWRPREKVENPQGFEPSLQFKSRSQSSCVTNVQQNVSLASRDWQLKLC